MRRGIDRGLREILNTAKGWRAVARSTKASPDNLFNLRCLTPYANWGAILPRYTSQSS